MCDNPKADPNRLATALWFPRVLEPVLRPEVQDMCDRPSLVVPVEIARVWRPIFTVYDEDVVSLVDDWDGLPVSALKRTPIGCVYCTTRKLLRWANVPVIRGETVHLARIELHEHVKRMNAYLQHRLANEVNA